MNCGAASAGVDSPPATATAAAINFAIIGSILPRYGGESERANAPGQPTPWAKIEVTDAASPLPLARAGQGGAVIPVMSAIIDPGVARAEAPCFALATMRFLG